MTAADILEAIRSFFQIETTTNVLWDFCGFDASALTSDDLAVVINEAKQFAHLRPGGRSAMIGPEDFQFGLGRMYATLAELKCHPVANGIFRRKEEAIVWLNRF
jgi:hypothetical protein